jgi:ABC-2 type transport system permease protein
MSRSMTDTPAESPPAAETGASRRAAVIPVWQVMAALIRREFWEHRALWMVPVATGALLVILAFVARFPIGAADNHMPFGPFNWNGPGRSVSDVHQIGIALAAMLQWVIAVVLFLAVAVTLFFYLLSSLYDERKDRSILFWKSLPISDTATVLSKLVVAVLIAPLAAYAIAIPTYLLNIGVWDIRQALGWTGGFAFGWDTVVWLKVEALTLMIVVLSALWYAPVAGYLLLVSAWSRRNAFLWAVLPPLILGIVERVGLGTGYVRNVVLGRLFGIWADLGSNTAASAAFNRSIVNTDHGRRLVSFPDVFDVVNLRGLFSDPALWVGILIAAALVYAAIRVRRYRDDT